MASTSSNNSINQSSNITSSMLTSPTRNYYDVFVSFRGKDTRYNFIDHLFAALRTKGISSFRDDTKLKKGESIAPELFQAIEDSQVFIVVFSKNYASSTWCLRELECILQCVKLSGKRVLPVFYDVDPSDVRHQKGIYVEALAKHEEIFQHDSSEMLQRWREALTQVANLSGWDLRAKPQYAEIEKIVKELINIMGYKFSSLPKDLVGMHSPIEILEKHLHLDSVDDVRVVGICGMGGIGKTALTTVLYNKISNQFPVCCLIDDVSKIYRHEGPIGVQKQILCQALGEEHLQTCNLYDTSNLIRSRLRNVKSLIILDNVDHIKQLEKLAMNLEWLGAGSRMIIISRDEHILKEFGTDVIYKVPLLNETNSLQLFSQKAFKLDHIRCSYEKMAFEILNYANGLPLAIRVLGSFLFGRNISEWKSTLTRLRERPNNDIMEVLQLSFDGLEEMEKEIFLHIACFFNQMRKEYVKNILNCCGFHADIGIRVLIDKSLIRSYGGRIVMHDLLQQLGMKIVQENSIKESRKWSKVWLQEQFYDVMFENMENKVEAIVLTNKVYTSHQYNRNMDLIVKLVQKMSHLRLLIINIYNSFENFKIVNISRSISCLSNELRYIEWFDYPFMDLPSSFQPNHLVELILKSSNIRQLWEGKKYLPKLKTLDLRHSKNLEKMPDFGEIPNLEELNLEECVKLVQIDQSIEILRKLVFLNLKDCKNLASIPNNIFRMRSLKFVQLSGCSKVFKNPRQFKNLDSSESSSADSQVTTSSILKSIMFRFHSLHPKDLVHPKDLASCLLHNLFNLSCLCKLDISFCGLSQIPNAIGCLRWLEELNLEGNNFVTLPSLRKLSKLAYLNLVHCKLLESLPQLPFPTTMEHTRKYDRIGLLIFNCPKLGERECCISMALFWMIQFIQANLQSSISSFHGNIDIIIPGSEMLIWFDNQSERNSIRIDTSPIVHDNSVNDFFGLCCCAVFSIDPTTTTYALSLEIEQSIYISNHHCAWNSKISLTLKRDLVELKSDHMYIIYIPLKLLINILKFTDVDRRPLVFQMIASVRNDNHMNQKVQNCGYRWVYKHDLQLMHHWINSLSSEVQVFDN